MQILSKFVIFLVDPTHLFLLLLALSALAEIVGQRRLARVGAALAGLVIGVAFLTPAGDHLARALEERIPMAENALARAKGAIVLGGGGATRAVERGREPYALNDAAERLTTIVMLRNARPELPILFSGGSGGLREDAVTEADLVRRFLSAMGEDPDAIRYEERSRNTFENARFSAEMLKDAPGPHLLVTSAAHMPRALSVFRKAGLDVLPFPVDYRAPEPSWSPLDMSRHRLERAGDAIKEVVGLVAYRLLDRSDAIWPEAPK